MNRRVPVPYSGFLFVALEIMGSRSMKDRRQVTQSLLDRIRRRWNVSAMDLGPDGSWSEAFVAVSAAASGVAMAEERLQAVYSFLTNEEETGEFSILYHWREVTRYDDISNAENQQADPERSFASAGAAHKERNGKESDHH
ncbi:MAG TPA: DUF503 family protein [Synergistaceae bacterium]|jgi:uncharacterized protein YlxP (DUF503 family)|nr:DUF503 family protein [Synergistaceae bacterium]